MHATTALIIVLVFAAALLSGCSTAGLYEDDVVFMNRYTDGFELTDITGQARVYVVPQYQGRVMTSTFGGVGGPSLGWINPPAIKAGIVPGPINVYGGEERFWIGPEGGQYSIFFKPGDTFDLDHWKTPPVIDTEPFELVKRDAATAEFRKTAKLTNMSGFTFDLRIDRSVRIIQTSQIVEQLTLPAGSEALRMVGYETVNSITNTGKEPWTEKTGMLSIWLLGQFPATPHTTAVLPLRAERSDDMGDRPGPNVYETFNKLGPDRLKTKGGKVFFKCDGHYRSKIGISPKWAMPVLGSYDAHNGVLTIVWYDRKPQATKYVKSTWEIQKDPFGGDVTNSYNDGGALGAFYELESSSPAAELKPDQSITHTSRTYHLTGPKAMLDKAAREVFGASLDQITSALP